MTLRCELEQCNEQILGLENRQAELERNAKNSHTALVQKEAPDRVRTPGDPDQYYYGHQMTRADGYDPEGEHAPTDFPPEYEILQNRYPHLIVRRYSFFARDPAMDEASEDEEELYGNEHQELYGDEHQALYGP